MLSSGNGDSACISASLDAVRRDDLFGGRPFKPLQVFAGTAFAPGLNGDDILDDVSEATDGGEAIETSAAEKSDAILGTDSRVFRLSFPSRKGDSLVVLDLAATALRLGGGFVS